MATLETNPHDEPADDGVRRRDVLNIAAVSFAGVGAVAVVAPMLVQMAPSADVLAMASTEVDVSKIQPGQAIKTSWRKQPVFVLDLTRSADAGRTDQAGQAELADHAWRLHPFGLHSARHRRGREQGAVRRLFLPVPRLGL
jgi:ubiquinol-cytochrome c reductase iron-sulfur subunit